MPISRAFRHQVRSRLRKRLRASCWVMVLAPRTTSPSRALLTRAWTTASRSTPMWRMNRRSSAAITADTTVGGMRCQRHPPGAARPRVALTLGRRASSSPSARSWICVRSPVLGVSAGDRRARAHASGGSRRAPRSPRAQAGAGPRVSVGASPTCLRNSDAGDARPRSSGEQSRNLRNWRTRGRGSASERVSLPRSAVTCAPVRGASSAARSCRRELTRDHARGPELALAIVHGHDRSARSSSGGRRRRRSPRRRPSRRRRRVRPSRRRRRRRRRRRWSSVFSPAGFCVAAGGAEASLAPQRRARPRRERGQRPAR